MAVMLESGLAVRKVSGGWMVTHVRSGMGLFTFPHRRQAYVALERLVPLSDWTRSAEEIDRLTEDPVMREAFKAVLDAAYAADADPFQAARRRERGS